MVISSALQACGVVFPFAIPTSIWRSNVTICSALYLLFGISSRPPREFSLTSAGTKRPGHVRRRTWIFLILSGIATGLSWLCYFRALQLGEASQVAPVDKLSVVIAIALAAIFLHEHLTWHHWLGGALIFTGAVVVASA